MIPGTCGNEVVNPGELDHFGVFRFAFGMCANALWKEHGGQLLIHFRVICLLWSFSTIHALVNDFNKGKPDVVSKWTVQALMVRLE